MGKTRLTRAKMVVSDRYSICCHNEDDNTDPFIISTSIGKALSSRKSQHE